MNIARWVSSASLGAVICLALVAGRALGGSVEPSPPDHQPVEEAAIRFDLPRQPLSIAIETFMSATNLIVLVDTALLDSRRSAPVSGIMTPQEALRQLLSGTGLNAVAIGQGAFTLQEPAARKGFMPGYLQYAATVQSAVTRALCQQTDTRGMQYRATLRLWVDVDGRVERVELASSTGDKDLDTSIVAALRSARVGVPPPKDLPQPVKLAVLPAAAGAACH